MRRQVRRDAQGPQRARIAEPLVPQLGEQSCDGLDIVAEYLGAGIQNAPDTAGILVEILDQRLDGRAGIPLFYGLDGSGYVTGTLVRQVIPGDRRDDHMAQLQALYGLGDVHRFHRVGRGGTATDDRAIGTMPGTDVAQHHDGGGAASPAFRVVGAVGALTYGVERRISQHALHFLERAACGPGTAQPFREYAVRRANSFTGFMFCLNLIHSRLRIEIDYSTYAKLEGTW